MKLHAIFLASICLTYCAAKPWRGTDEFIAGLYCDMPKAKIQAYVTEVRGLQIKSGERLHGPALVAQKSNTLIFLWLQDDRDRLEAYQVSWSYPLTNQARGLKQNLCSGQQFVDLHLVGSSSVAGAKVTLDGEAIGTLSSVGTMSLDVPLGSHRIIVRSSLGTWSTDLVYNQESPGYDRREIRLPSM